MIAGTRVDELAAVARLQRKHPAVVRAVVLRDLAGLSYQAIAEEVDVKVSTVKARIRAARQFVRGELQGEGNKMAPRRI